MKFPKSRFAGTRATPVVRLLDVLPTILETAGVPFAAAAFDGRSLQPVLEGRDKADRPVAADIAENVLEYRTPLRIALSAGRDKVIVNETFKPEYRAVFPAPPPDPPAVEVYDLTSDPGERSNLASNAAKAQSARELVRAASGLAQSLPPRGVGKTKIPKELEDQLRALGYIR